MCLEGEEPWLRLVAGIRLLLHRQVAGQQDIQHRREGCIRLAVGIQIDPVVDIRQVVVDILGLAEGIQVGGAADILDPGRAILGPDIRLYLQGILVYWARVECTV